jgi:2-polyprenyl-3-methyl-5-hydroxy-6-metoxy-1,4-benzoquinol methylase
MSTQTERPRQGASPTPSAESLERLVPDELSEDDVTGHETLRLHLERYEFAARLARPGRLLDMACGVGYGTRLLADRAPQVSEALGVDLSARTVRYAQQRYAGDRVSFRPGDALAFQDPAGFDTIVSLETLEHVPDPESLADRLAGLLRPGGFLVASVPTTPSVDVNPHHLTDFTAASFRRMFATRGLSERDAFPQRQDFQPLSVLRRTEKRMSDMRPNLVSWYLGHPGAAAKRALATLRYGFANHYLTIAWQRP